MPEVTIDPKKQQSYLGQIYWLFVKEFYSFVGANFPTLCLALIFCLFALLSILPHRIESSLIDLSRLLFHLFYVVILATGTIFAVPSFVTEKRQGTFELLYTLPITDAQLVIAKFLMGALILSVIVVPTSFVYIFWLAQAPWYTTFTGAFGLLFAGLYAYSVGIFASSISSSYFASFLIASFILVAIDVLGYLSGLLPSPFREIISYFHALDQFFYFTRGLLSARATIFFLSLISFFLFASVKVLESRRYLESKR